MSIQQTFDQFCFLVDCLLEDGQIDEVKNIIIRQTNRNGVTNVESQAIIDMCNEKLESWKTNTIGNICV